MDQIDVYDAEAEAEGEDFGEEDQMEDGQVYQDEEMDYEIHMDQDYNNHYVPEEDDDVVRLLVISPAHEHFELDKKLAEDETVGMVNDRHIVC